MKLANVLLAAVLLVAANAAHADGPSYIGVGIGHASLNRGSLSLAGGQQGGIDGTQTAKTLFLGYDLSDIFSIEGAYHDYGAPTAFYQNTSGSCAPGQPPFACSGIHYCPDNATRFSCPSLQGYSAVMVARYEVAPQLYLAVLAGEMAWKAGDPGKVLLKEDQGEVFLYGLRVMKKLDYGFSVDVTYERSQFTTEETRIGLRYSF
ncbi:MAG TPA: outer membrane beta-barrel protein [Gammaproteobacteria bacterium]